MRLKEFAKSLVVSLGKPYLMERTSSKTLGNHKKMEEQKTAVHLETIRAVLHFFH